MKKAVIVGHTGQDGTYLKNLLLEKDYDLIGISSTSCYSTTFSFKANIDIRDFSAVELLIKAYQPDEVYYLAAVHQSSADKPIAEGELFQKSIDINLKAPVNFLESIRLHSSNTKFFFAASSHIFGNPSQIQQDEETPFNPVCIYGTTKTAGINASRYYRNNHGIFASTGIFYNHESPIRESKYVSKKIVETAVAIKNNLAIELILGNLESKIDWGYAPDYMNAIHKILNHTSAQEFIVSSGELHTVGEFVEEVFNLLKLDWKKYVKINPHLITKNQKRNLFGDNRKLIRETGWLPSVSFKELIGIIVNEELVKQTIK